MTSTRVEKHLFVVFGATGDLFRRKLLPAWANLAAAGLLDGSWAVLGTSRSDLGGDDGFRKLVGEALADADLEPGVADRLPLDLFHHLPMGGGTAEDFARLAEKIASIEQANGLPGNRVFYLALPPAAFGPTIEGLGQADLAASPGWTRLVIEKPIGHDLASARELNEKTHCFFDESQIFRIDHYLGKETVQNLLVFRFANAIFESMWNRDRIEQVQITVAESLGVGSRADYYDRAGALRDMVQNHVTQLLTLVAAEVPGAFDADAVRYEKIKVLKAIAPIEPGDVVFGQYGAGTAEGRDVVGYRREEDVPDDSRTETYVALRLHIDTWRWQGVPFYVRTGKRLARRLSQIAVTFRRAPVCLFEASGACETRPNVLTLTLQPDEGFALCVDVKAPGEPFSLKTLPLDFRYAEAFGALPDAYQTLLLDVLEGDQTLFVHAEEAEASWRLYAPLLDHPPEVHPYAAGRWGPAAADALLAERGHAWSGPPCGGASDVRS